MLPLDSSLYLWRICDSCCPRCSQSCFVVRSLQHYGSLSWPRPGSCLPRHLPPHPSPFHTSPDWSSFFWHIQYQPNTIDLTYWCGAMGVVVGGGPRLLRGIWLQHIEQKAVRYIGEDQLCSLGVRKCTAVRWIHFSLQQYKNVTHASRSVSQCVSINDRWR